MSDPDAIQVPESVAAEPDFEMVEDVNSAQPDAGEPAANGEDGDTFPAWNPQTIFLNHLKSPLVELVVGGEEEETTVITAHQSVLTKSPFFAERLSNLSPSDPKRVELPGETLDTVGCFLQYQYTGEYFPRRIPSIPDGLELDPSIPAVDETGEQLLKHARIYSLAEKLGLPDLKTLAYSKINRVNSTAVGEIAYARYVYGNTPKDDITIRRPVVVFWATRAHILRHEAQEEFRTMCLEFPEFTFDVLSLMLDQREKRGREREHKEGGEEAMPGKVRKKVRPSVNY